MAAKSSIIIHALTIRESIPQVKSPYHGFDSVSSRTCCKSTLTDSCAIWSDSGGVELEIEQFCLCCSSTGIPYSTVQVLKPGTPFGCVCTHRSLEVCLQSPAAALNFSALESHASSAFQTFSSHCLQLFATATWWNHVTGFSSSPCADSGSPGFSVGVTAFLIAVGMWVAVQYLAPLWTRKEGSRDQNHARKKTKASPLRLQSWSHASD